MREIGIDTAYRYSLPRLTDKDMIRDSISNMKNGKATGPTGAVSEMVKTVGEAEVDMITGLVNQIDYKRSSSSRMGTQHFCNCYKGKGDSLERGNYRRLKVIDQIFINFYLEAVPGDIFSTKEEFALCICRFGESF